MFSLGAVPIPAPLVIILRPARYRISGVTRDNNGNPLAGCTVEIYETASNLFRGSTISDANGNYAVDVTSGETGLTFQAVAYLAGAPDVAGVSLNTLTGTAT